MAFLRLRGILNEMWSLGQQSVWNTPGRTVSGALGAVCKAWRWQLVTWGLMVTVPSLLWSQSQTCTWELLCLWSLSGERVLDLSLGLPRARFTIRQPAAPRSIHAVNSGGSFLKQVCRRVGGIPPLILLFFPCCVDGCFLASTLWGLNGMLRGKYLARTRLSKQPQVLQADLVLPHFALLHFSDNCIFLRIEGLWQLCVDQVCRPHFSNSICSVCIPVSHFGNSYSISNFFVIITFVVVICGPVIFDDTIAKRLQRAEGSGDGYHLLTIKYFFN